MAAGLRIQAGARPAEAGARSAAARRARRVKKTAAYVGLSITGLFMVVPFYWMVLLALQERGGVGLLQWPPALFPHWPIQFNNFSDGLTRFPFWRFYMNSALITVLSVSGTLVTSSIAAFAFARLRFRGRDSLFVVMLATLMVPPQVTLIPQFILFRWFQWYDTFYPLWVPNWTGSAFAIFLLRQYFMTMPKELEDAARIDGANPFRIYWQIFLPLSKPVLATLGVLVFLGSWNDLLGPVIYLSSVDNYTVQLGLAFFNNSYDLDIIALMSASLISILPPIVVFIMAQGYFVRGVVLTGLKG